MINFYTLIKNISRRTRALINFYTYSYQLTRVSCTPGDNYTVNVTDSNPSAYLVGNTIRVYFSATRKTTLSQSNNTNERILTMVFNHGGKIQTGHDSAYNAFFTDTARVSGLGTAAVAVTSTTITIGVNLNATAHNMGSPTCYFMIPVVVNLDTYANPT